MSSINKVIAHFIFLFSFPIVVQAQSPCSCDSLNAYIKRNDYKRVDSCLNAGINPNCAVVSYPSEILEHRSYQIEIRPRTFTRPLLAAAKSGNLALVKLLVEHGADVSKGEYSGYDTLADPLWGAAYSGKCISPLDIAIAYRKDSVIKYLREKHALTGRQQIELGNRFYTLVANCRSNDSSLIAYQQFMRDSSTWIAFKYHPDSVMAVACSLNVLSAIKFLYQQCEASLLDTHTLTYYRGFFDFKTGYLDYQPFTKLFYGKYCSIESIEYFREQHAITDEQLEKNLTRYLPYSFPKIVRYYYLSYFALKKESYSGKESRTSKKLKAKMQKYYLEDQKRMPAI